MDKIEMNKVIAEFMGAVINPKWTDSITYSFERNNSPTRHSSLHFMISQMRYQESYDWIMPVWVKFRDLKFETLTVHQRTNFEIHTYIIGNAILKEPITEAHKLLFEAIQWYNSINNINKEK